jgi:putative Mg2+ transporter-C (MgtC) family protein
MADMDLFGWPDASGLVRVVIRLGSAAILGGLIGLERERAGKAAGTRTHMMVALGAALFVLVPSLAGLEQGDLSRVIQGIAAGIGFLGGGTIIKRSSESDIEGLTSAATIWFTGAIGIAVGVGQIWLALVGVVSAWAVLSMALRLDRWVSDRRRG